MSRDWIKERRNEGGTGEGGKGIKERGKGWRREGVEKKRDEGGKR